MHRVTPSPRTSKRVLLPRRLHDEVVTLQGSDIILELRVIFECQEKEIVTNFYLYVENVTLFLLIRS